MGAHIAEHRVLDLSAGTDAYPSVLAAGKGLFPAAGLWLEGMGLGDAEELAQLEHQVWIALLAETFYATLPLVTVWGEKSPDPAPTIRGAAHQARIW
jgi:hypothetical protein